MLTHFKHPREGERESQRKKNKNAAFENQGSQGRLKFCSLQILEIPKDSAMLQEDFSSYHVVCARSNFNHR